MVMIAKKKQTRLKPIGRTPKARVSERGDSIGRVGRRPSKPARKPLGGVAAGASTGMATAALNKAAMELARRQKPSGRLNKDDMDRALDMIKGKKGKPSDLKRPPTMSKEKLEKIKRLLKDKLGNTKRREPVKPKFRKPVAKMPPRRNRAGFMKK